MAWHGTLTLSYSVDRSGGAARCVVADRHVGPMRVLAALHPEAPSICHSVVVHPPGGIAGGDVLEIDVALGTGAHALLTTPGATRFYRSAGAAAAQRVDARLADGARLEWLPLETIVHPGALAESRCRFTLDPGAETIGRDVVALGLPAAGQPFDRGRFTQHVELPGAWLERGTIDGADARLMNSPLGLGGRTVVATQWFAAGAPIDAARRAALLDAARTAAGAGDPVVAGATSPDARVVVVRALAHRTEPATALLNRVWAAWRETAWGLPAPLPRVWRT
jgi:urease accessory protein